MREIDPSRLLRREIRSSAAQGAIAQLIAPPAGGLRGVYHRAGPPGPAFGRPDDRQRPDPVANPTYTPNNAERRKIRHDPTAVLLYGNGRVS